MAHAASRLYRDNRVLSIHAVYPMLVTLVCDFEALCAAPRGLSQCPNDALPAAPISSKLDVFYQPDTQICPSRRRIQPLGSISAVSLP